MIRLAILFFSCTLSCVALAEIYTWVDAEGLTHYSATPPVTVLPDQVDTSTGESRTAHYAAPILSAEAAALAEVLKKELLSDKGQAKKVNCPSAIENAYWAIDTMLNVGEQNYNDGYLDRKQYKALSRKLEKAKLQITLEECESANPEVQNFYLCLSNSKNHLAMCGKKYNYKVYEE